ncbi:hypothetical protein LEP1GSC170_1021 [Leptospira interrogans serovar Bataviae str. HAI135]|nr:hypothetical protein LEP1GSC170_1021 [Leptospira interrogans serovar Bataviae str. HAI135]
MSSIRILPPSVSKTTGSEIVNILEFARMFILEVSIFSERERLKNIKDSAFYYWVCILI